ncbi:MAG TPA: hypothetical protein VGU71_04195 [Candidatus Dormibacteraeota bacterium]|nr:hypothetical protein [Candidatus Dormibacteraeota bacterium]
MAQDLGKGARARPNVLPGALGRPRAPQAPLATFDRDHGFGLTDQSLTERRAALGLCAAPPSTCALEGFSPLPD